MPQTSFVGLEFPVAIRMSSSAPASDISDSEIARLRDFLHMEPLVRRYDVFLQIISRELISVRRWFVKTLDVWAREIVMTFLDSYDAEPIAELELEIHRPELARARKRRKGMRSHPKYFDIFFKGG